eukprot:g30019.t1
MRKKKLEVGHHEDGPRQQERGGGNRPRDIVAGQFEDENQRINTSGITKHSELATCTVLPPKEKDEETESPAVCKSEIRPGKLKLSFEEIERRRQDEEKRKVEEEARRRIEEEKAAFAEARKSLAEDEEDLPSLSMAQKDPVRPGKLKLSFEELERQRQEEEQRRAEEDARKRLEEERKQFAEARRNM